LCCLETPSLYLATNKQASVSHRLQSTSIVFVACEDFKREFQTQPKPLFVDSPVAMSTIRDRSTSPGARQLTENIAPLSHPRFQPSGQLDPVQPPSDDNDLDSEYNVRCSCEGLSESIVGFDQENNDALFDGRASLPVCIGTSTSWRFRS
jgi:hypothetical protein